MPTQHVNHVVWSFVVDRWRGTGGIRVDETGRVEETGGEQEMEGRGEDRWIGQTYTFLR